MKILNFDSEFKEEESSPDFYSDDVAAVEEVIHVPVLRRKLKILLGSGGLAAILALSPTLAANINLSASNRVEFGQGFAQATGCDSALLVTPTSNFANSAGAGSHNIDQINVSDIAAACVGKTLKINLFSYTGTAPLNTDAILINFSANPTNANTYISSTWSSTSDFTVRGATLKAASIDTATISSLGSNESGKTSVTINAITNSGTGIASANISKITVESQVTSGAGNGSSAANAAASGYVLKTDYPGLPSGLYWIKSASMPNALQMYVDMTTEGGGYDYYFITGGISVNAVNLNNSGTALGLDLVMPRSKLHWQSMYNIVNSSKPSGSNNDYFTTTYGVYSDTPGNYTSIIMRSTYYGSGTTSWKVKDGGRWWLRDTTYGEPNGDYTAKGLLGPAGGIAGSGMGDLSFNDLSGGLFTGGSYLVSTNAKP